MDLTLEELGVLESSPVCLNCGHREVLHSQDSEYGTECHVCGCTELIKEGDYSYWSIERYKYRSLCEGISSALEAKLLDAISLPSWSIERDLPTRKTLRIQRLARIKLPLDTSI